MNSVRGLLQSLTSARKPRPDSCHSVVSPAVDTPAAPSGKKILIVDDDAIILATSSLKLRSEGYAVVTALDCSEVIGMVRDERPDLILIDLMFPPNLAQGVVVAWDGLVIMSWLSQFRETRNVPIIIITEQDPAKLEDRLLRASSKAFFQKPIDHEGLLRVIEQTLGEAPEGRQRNSSLDSQI